MKKAGIPTAVVVDFDVILDDEGWTKVSPKIDHLAKLGITSTRRQELIELYVELRELFQSCERQELAAKGLTALGQENITIAENFLNELRSIGLFVVPIGDLESLLKRLLDTKKDISKNSGANRVIDLLYSNKLGIPAELGDPADNIWSFVRAIAYWINE